MTKNELDQAIERSKSSIRTHQDIIIILVGLAIVTAIISTISGDWWGGFLQNFSTEMVGAFITYLLIERILGERRRAEEKTEAEDAEKRRLIIQLGSKDNASALTALTEIRTKELHKDGLLKGVELDGANLQDALLNQCRMQNSSLRNANLASAKLNLAHLEGVNLVEANLRNADLLGAKFDSETILPDAKYIFDLDKIGLVYDKYWTTTTDMRRYTDPNHVNENGNPDFWQPDWVKEQDEE